MSEQKSFWSLRVLRTFCPSHLFEEIEGDLLQRYERDLKPSDLSNRSDGYWRRRAKRRLFWNVIRFFRPEIVLRHKISTNENQFTMLNNYFVTSIRHIRKSKVNFGFKIGGLTLAIFSFLAIAVYISYQLSFDKFHDNYENIYRVTSQFKENEAVLKYANVPSSLGPLLYQNFKEVGSFSRIAYWNGAYIRYGEKVVDCEGLVSADSTLFSTLSFQFLKGNKKALRNPHAIILTESKAKNLFGTIDVLQRQINITSEKDFYEVGAVIADLPSNSHLWLDAIVLNGKEKQSTAPPTDFSNGASILYLKFQHSINPISFEQKIEKLLDVYASRADRKKTGFTLSLQRLQDIYLGPRFNEDIANKGSSIYVYCFSTLGVLLLLVAAINRTPSVEKQ